MLARSFCGLKTSTSFNAARVPLPTMPSAAMPFSSWKAIRPL
jgi:hypothetical protein